MATEFTADVKSAGGDYTSISLAQTGLKNDLTAATIKVFSISASTGTTIAAGDSVVGQTSTATGVCVLVNAARTQILIKTIAVSTFQSGEVVQKSGDVTKTVTLSNAGDSPIVGVRCFAFQDTTAVTVSGWTLSATNYFRIYAAPGAGAKMPYDTSTAYRLEVANGAALTLNQAFIRVERIQIKYTSPASPNAGRCISSGQQAGTGFRYVIGCYLKVVTHVSNTTIVHGASAVGNLTGVSKIALINCIVEGADSTGNAGNAGFLVSNNNTNTMVVSNCLAYNCSVGFSQTGTNVITAKNCMYDRGASSSHTGFAGTIGGDYNASTEADAPGAHSRNSQTFTYVNSGTGDYHLATTDAGARGFGTDLSADATYPFSTDFDNFTRLIPWDMGPTYVRTVGPIRISKNRMDMQGIPIRAASTILSTTPSAGTVAGITFTLVSNETQAVGDVVMVNASGKAAIANASTIATAAGIFIAATAVTGSASNTYLVHGVVRFASSQGWTAGDTIYLSTTGTTTTTLTNIAPSGTDNVIQILGVALANDTLNFHPELLMLEHV